MVMYYETFPTAIGFSATRKDFYIGAVVHNIILCLSMAVIQGVLMKLDGFIIEAIGRNPLYDQLMLNTKEDSLLYIILMLFIIFLFVSALFNLLGATLYKLTWKLWILIGAVLMAIFNIEPLFNTVGNFFIKLIGYTNPQQSILYWAIRMIGISVLLYFLTFLVIRKVSLRSRG